MADQWFWFGMIVGILSPVWVVTIYVLADWVFDVVYVVRERRKINPHEVEERK